MARPWIRLYTDLTNHAKIQRLPDHLFKFLINAWCLTGEGDDELLPAADEIAWRLHIDPEICAAYLSHLAGLGLIDEADGGYRPHNWDDRQFISDDSKDRVARYRKRMASAGMAANGYSKHREAILKRDAGACIYCTSTESLCIDHVVPIIKGGDDDPMNLAIACKSCNSGKSGRTPEEAGYKIVGVKYSTLYRENVSRLHNRDMSLLHKTSVTKRVTVQDSDQIRLRSDSDPDARASIEPTRPSPAPPQQDGTDFQSQFTAAIRTAGYEIPEQLAPKLCAYAIKKKAEVTQAAVCYLNFYHRAIAVGGVKDGEAYLIGGFKKELDKLLNGTPRKGLKHATETRTIAAPT